MLFVISFFLECFLFLYLDFLPHGTSMPFLDLFHPLAYLACCFFCIFLNSLFLSSSSTLFRSFSLRLALSALFFAAFFSSAVSSAGASSLCRTLKSFSRSRSTVFRVLMSLRETYLSACAM